MDVRMYHASTQLLGVAIEVTAIPGTTVTLDTYPSSVAILPTTDDGPTSLDFYTAQWVIGAHGPYVVIMIGPGSGFGTLTPGRYHMWIKITASPEVPVLRCPDRLVIY